LTHTLTHNFINDSFIENVKHMEATSAYCQSKLENLRKD